MAPGSAPQGRRRVQTRRVIQQQSPVVTVELTWDDSEADDNEDFYEEIYSDNNSNSLLIESDGHFDNDNAFIVNSTERENDIFVNNDFARTKYIEDPLTRMANIFETTFSNLNNSNFNGNNSKLVNRMSSAKSTLPLFQGIHWIGFVSKILSIFRLCWVSILMRKT